MQMRIVEVKGKDAADFLHRVTAGTVKGVAVGEGRPGLLLNGKSLVQAQFELLRTGEQEFLLASPEACAQKLAEGLEALHFSESLEIRLTERTAGIRACSGAKREAGQSFPFFRNGEELTWNSGVPGYGYSTGINGAPSDFDFHRIAALQPSPSDWTETTPALEAGFFPVIDRYKGCYPGQEVVELSLNVGHPVRVLLAVESGEPFKEKISWNGAEGTVTSSASLDGKHAALVRVPWKQKDFLPPGFTLLKSHW